MRLLHTRTLELKSFFENIPPYAILSHCWEEEEVVFSDLADLDAAKKKLGFSKIEKTCAQAVKDGFDWCWVDTCCIDKSSSAELSEAINSMFSWYRESAKCYAYLADVGGPSEFANSKWFTRSWTLQELLAPSHIQTDDQTGMEFFSRDWKRLGSKGGLGSRISEITGVPREYLERLSLDRASISMRMSWAADRQATRAEDVAYSLLGIFDVNMPLLYGEGKSKAFRRLQEEIMKISEDETLFAWESMEFSTDSSSVDVLASDPRDFSEAKDLVPFTSDGPVVPYNMTHRGLRIWLYLYNLSDPQTAAASSHRWIRPLSSQVMIWSSQDLVWAALRCHVAHDYHNYVMIPLRHLEADIYSRDTSTNVALVPVRTPLASSLGLKEVYIRNSRIPSIKESIQRKYAFFLRDMADGVAITGVLPKQAWNQRGSILQGHNDSSGRVSWHASLRLTITRSKLSQRAVGYVFLSLGCKQQSGNVKPAPWCYLDDTVYEYERHDGNLERFHEGSFALQNRQETILSTTGESGEQHEFRLKIHVTPKRIFGQYMFVVDIDHEDVGEHNVQAENKLEIPEPSMHQKIFGLFVENKLSIEPTPNVQVNVRGSNFQRTSHPPP
ncbi:hypothetical protein HBH71_052550 [Parastagonospora nodorum]|nr:hypothetical protein HBH71_052550 [Parastagonospora nodorum]KAH5546220.1 hypothetical protein HBI27_047790 [Parastagonospora nodorum]